PRAAGPRARDDPFRSRLGRLRDRGRRGAAPRAHRRPSQRPRRRGPLGTPRGCARDPPPERAHHRRGARARALNARPPGRRLRHATRGEVRVITAFVVSCGVWIVRRADLPTLLSRSPTRFARRITYTIRACRPSTFHAETRPFRASEYTLTATSRCC